MKEAKSGARTVESEYLIDNAKVNDGYLESKS